MPYSLMAHLNRISEQTIFFSSKLPISSKLFTPSTLLPLQLAKRTTCTTFRTPELAFKTKCDYTFISLSNRRNHARNKHSSIVHGHSFR